MSTERPTFPPVRENPFRLVGGTETSVAPRRREPAPAEQEISGQLGYRGREDVQQEIDLHIAARVAYGRAVAWEAAAESENLPPAQIEDARRRTAEALEEMQFRGRCLVIVMPTWAAVR